MSARLASSEIVARSDRIARLRQIVTGLEGLAPGAGGPHLPLGVPEVDRHLCGAGLACGALHEVAEAAHGDRPAAFGFAVALTTLGLAARPGPAVLIAERRCFMAFGRPYGHGLSRLGLDAGRLVLVEARSDKDALWAMEEALRSGAAAMVSGAVAGDPNLTMTRRLSLAAAASGTPLLLMRTPETGTASAAATRWRIAAAPAARDRFGTLAAPRWDVDLERCRNGRSGRWVLEWDHAAYRFRLAPGLADRAPLEGASTRLRLAG